MNSPASADSNGIEKPSRRKRRGKILAVLDGDRTLTLTGGDIDLDRFCALLDRLLIQAKRAKGQAIQLSTFLRILADQNGASIK